MSLEIIINEDIKKAMLAKDKRKLEALRAIKSALLIEKTGKGHGDEEIPESVEMKLLQKQVKQRMESAETYEQQGRKDLAEEERYQADIIKAYLPQQLDEAAIKAKVESIIKELGATSMKDVGKVMGVATKELAGKADNSIISKFVKDALG